MTNDAINARIGEISHRIFSYCATRTSNHFDAEDMAQDILLALAKSLPNLRSDEAFYGFMWSVAGKVANQWYRKKYRRSECELTEASAVAPDIADTQDDMTDIGLLRRELALLNARHRKVTIMYYIENMSCAAIAEKLGLTESNVKYLLFKSRKIIREGMEMDRTYGNLSYNPRRLESRFWCLGFKRADLDLTRHPISSNILLACYNDQLTEKEISLEIGVSLPYIESELKSLVELDVVTRNGSKYMTNIPIITSELNSETLRCTHQMHSELVETVKECIAGCSDSIRALGFYGSDMCENSLRWQLAVRLLHMATVDRFMRRDRLAFENTRFGDPCCVWAEEPTEDTARIGITNLKTTRGDLIRFVDTFDMDPVHHYFLPHPTAKDVLSAIAVGRVSELSENDLAVAAEMVKMGYMKNDRGTLSVNMPAFTARQYAALETILSPHADLVAELAEKARAELARLYRDHFPAHLRRLADSMSYLIMLTMGIAVPLDILKRDGYLIRHTAAEMLPTTHIILAD